MKLMLEWPVDVRGYEVQTPARPEPPPKNASALEKRAWRETHGRDDLIIGSSFEPRIVPKGGRVGRYDAMEIPALYERLADTDQTEEGAIEFANKFGLLTTPDWQLLSEFIGLTAAIARLVKMKRTGNKNAWADWLERHGKNIRLHAHLHDSKTGRQPSLFFQPMTLFDAIVLQFFQDVTIGAQVRLCKRPGCGEWFKYGVGTGRRNTAQFCSPRCQASDYHLKAKGEEQ